MALAHVQSNAETGYFSAIETEEHQPCAIGWVKISCRLRGIVRWTGWWHLFVDSEFLSWRKHWHISDRRKPEGWASHPKPVPGNTEAVLSPRDGIQPSTVTAKQSLLVFLPRPFPRGKRKKRKRVNTKSEHRPGRVMWPRGAGQHKAMKNVCSHRMLCIPDWQHWHRTDFTCLYWIEVAKGKPGLTLVFAVNQTYSWTHLLQKKQLRLQKCVSTPCMDVRWRVGVEQNRGQKRARNTYTSFFCWLDTEGHTEG